LTDRRRACLRRPNNEAVEIRICKCTHAGQLTSRFALDAKLLDPQHIGKVVALCNRDNCSVSRTDRNRLLPTLALESSAAEAAAAAAAASAVALACASAAALASACRRATSSAACFVDSASARARSWLARCARDQPRDQQLQRSTTLQPTSAAWRSRAAFAAAACSRAFSSAS
jgi:hypothetical protein